MFRLSERIDQIENKMNFILEKMERLHTRVNDLSQKQSEIVENLLEMKDKEMKRESLYSEDFRDIDNKKNF